jgi:hypothetical protein
MTANRLTGEIASRLAMAVVAAGLLYCGFKFIRTAEAMQANYYHSHPYEHPYYSGSARSHTNIGLAEEFGWGLIVAGAALGLGAVAPISIVEKFLSPPEY